MNSVYVLITDGYNYHEILGVFDCLERAKAFIPESEWEYSSDSHDTYIYEKTDDECYFIERYVVNAELTEVAM